MERDDKKSTNARAAPQQFEDFVEALLKKSPDVFLAKKIMEETKKVQRTPLTFDQSNYYRLPLNFELSEGGQRGIGAFE